MSPQRSQKLSACVKVAVLCLIITTSLVYLFHSIIDSKRKCADVKAISATNTVTGRNRLTARRRISVPGGIVQSTGAPSVMPVQPCAAASVPLRPSAAVFTLSSSPRASDSYDLLSRTWHIQIDNSGIHAHWGKLDLEGGVMTVSWGNAEGQSQLDVINPVDLSDPAEIDLNKRKIARPMLYGSFDLTPNVKIEGVFLPTFEGNSIPKGMLKPIEVAKAYEHVSIQYPETNNLDYAQAGFRVNRQKGSTDIGFQYFYGFLPKLALSDIAVTTDKSLVVKMDYNRYQQIGADYSAVFGNYRLRSEIAANITRDLSGDDGSVYNPAMLWSLGFSRLGPEGSQVDVQGSGSVRLMNDRIGSTASDTEYGTNMTDTTLLVKITKKFAKDAFELSASARYGIETADCLVKPSVVWAKDKKRIELACVIFSGQTNAKDSVALSFMQQF